MNFLAKAVSTLLHPLLMPLLIFSFICGFLPELMRPLQADMFVPILSFIALSTLLAPCLLVLFMYKLNLVATFNIADRNDRYIPQILSTLLYAMTTWFFYSRMPMVHTLFMLMGSMTLCMVCVTAINFFWKISAHSAGIGGFCAFMLFASGNLPVPVFCTIGICCFLLSGCVLAARLYLHVHTLGQVCAGFILGLAIATWGVSNIS